MMTTITNTIDLTHVETLVYAYPSPHGGKLVEMEVEDPKSFRVTPDGGHEITEHGGVVTVMARGRLQIEVYPNRDCTPFNDA